MRVFITGATGYIGRAVADAFSHAGRHVYGLVRSEEKAKQLRKAEIVPIIGDLAKPETFKSAVHDAEVLIHCAFETSAKGLELENRTVDTLLTEASKSNKIKAFIYTSGVWVIGNTNCTLVDEAMPLQPLDLVRWRVYVEERVLNASSNRLRAVVLRPGIVYGGSEGIISFWFESTKKGVIEIVGEGHNYWPMIHYRDLAEAYRLTAEKELNGIALNIVDDSLHPVKEMALAVSKTANVHKIKSLTYEEAVQQFGPVAEGLLADQQISNERAKRLLGWHPKHRSFITDIDLYYNAWLASI